MRRFSCTSSFQDWRISRSPLTQVALVRNFLAQPIARQMPESIAKFQDLCRNRTLLDALNGAGLRVYGVGPEEWVLLIDKSEPLAVGQTIPVYLRGNKSSLAITSTRYFDLGKEIFVDMPVRSPVPVMVSPPVVPVPAPAPVAEQLALCGLVAGEGLQPALNYVRRFSPFNDPVIITGETGTGKELIARMVHANSPRRDSVFSAVNCAALPENLIESELFGHEKGSFTGAVALHKGVFELASAGTVFLDEIGDMPLLAQSKLLRVLSSGSFTRVGGSQQIETGARVVAATNKNLKAEAEAGRFRQDLFYRLNVLDIYLPPLRARKGDILELAGNFLAKAIQRSGKGLIGFAPDAEEALLSYPWPGNVRELEHLITRAVVMADGERITAADLHLNKTGSLSDTDLLFDLGRLAAEQKWGFGLTLRKVEKQLLVEALKRADGSILLAARSLGLKPNNLFRLLKRNGLISSGTDPQI